MNNVTPITPNYLETGVSRFRSNPFIEALPKLEQNKIDFLTNLAHYPTQPTSATRRSGEVVRLMELSTINDIVIPFPEYQKASLALATIIRETYVSRNPLSPTDRQRRHALAVHGADGIPFPADWKSSAKGHLLMAISGMGKTTFALSFLLRYPQVISHIEYKEKPLRCTQIVYLILRAPHDGTLKSLCLQFFEAIDKLIGTNYASQAVSVRQIAPMVRLMTQVATAVSLGFIVVDEVQNLKNARGGNAEFVLNLFSELVERAGVSLLIIATPAIQPVIEGSVRNGRKIASGGETILRPMSSVDPQWIEFCETYWEYTFTKKKPRLTKDIMKAWHNCSAGNSAFAAAAFMLAQRNEIGCSEAIDEMAFQRTSATDMAFLQPAIDALLSGNSIKLQKFDDLLFSPQYKALRQLLGAPNEAPPSIHDEFEDLNTDGPEPETKIVNKKAKGKKTSTDIDLPLEDPLSMV